MLYIHRHPVDVYSSRARRGQDDPDAGWARISPREFAAKYDANTRKALAEAAHRPQTVALVSYDRFTARPEEELWQICTFIGEPFEAGRMLEQAPGTTLESGHHLYGDIATSTADWRTQLDAGDVRLIQDLLHPAMVRLGYKRYGS